MSNSPTLRGWRAKSTPRTTGPKRRNGSRESGSRCWRCESMLYTAAQKSRQKRKKAVRTQESAISLREFVIVERLYDTRAAAAPLAEIQGESRLMPTQKTTHKSALKAKGKKKETKKKSNGAKNAGAKAAASSSSEATSKTKEKLKKSKAVAPPAADDIDPEEAADEAAALAEVDPDAVQDHVDEEPIADRKEVKDLLEVGRQKGFLTYDEVNDALPADIVSSDQIDDVMSMFGDNEIEIVDAQKAAKASDAKQAGATVEEPHKDLEEEEQKDEDDEPGGKSNDPVRLYLRKMGSVSLLTREGEVEIAKRIEEGEKEVLRAVLACKVAVAEILEISNKLRSGKLRIREVVKDAPEEPSAEPAEEMEAVEGAEPETAAQQLNQSELNRIEQICKQIERIRKYAKDVETLEEDLSGKKKVTEVRKREVKQEIKDIRVKM